MLVRFAECEMSLSISDSALLFSTLAFPTHLFADEYLIRKRIFTHRVGFYGELLHVTVVITDPSHRPFRRE